MVGENYCTNRNYHMVKSLSVTGKRNYLPTKRKFAWPSLNYISPDTSMKIENIVVESSLPHRGLLLHHCFLMTTYRNTYFTHVLLITSLSFKKQNVADEFEVDALEVACRDNLL